MPSFVPPSTGQRLLGHRPLARPRASARHVAGAASVGGPSEDEFTIIDTVAAVADELGTTSAVVSLAWLRAREGTIVPILGARRVEHLDNNLAALELTPHNRAPPGTDELPAAGDAGRSSACRAAGHRLRGICGRNFLRPSLVSG
jgi:aryl-alcohol dehydrogenase-like predicted oxidoreductase